MMRTLGKGDKSAIQSKLLFEFYNDGFISTSNSEQEEQTNREKHVFYCSVSKIHINPKKTHKKPHSNDYLNLPILVLSKKIGGAILRILIADITKHMWENRCADVR